MKRLFLIIVLFVAVVQVKAQKLSTLEVDKITYQYYLNGQWKELIQLANKAIEQGIDFFYLRTRLGLAYYYRGQYRLAARQFEKALSWYPQDKWTLEMLYYSYLFGGQYADAYKLIYDFPLDLRNKVLKDPDRNLQTWSLYYTNLTVRNADALRYPDIDGDYNIKGEQTITYGYNIPSFTATWRHYRGYKTLSYAYYAYDNLYRLQEFNDTIDEKPEYIRQHAINYIFVSSENENIDMIFSFSPVLGSVKRTAELTVTRGRWVNSRVTVLQSTPIFDFSASWGLTYKKPKLSFTSYISAQLYSYKPNLQLTITPVFYPYAGPKLYFAPGLIVKQDLKETQFLATASAGFSVKNRLFVSFEGWYGRMGYFNTGFGEIIYNDNEQILNKIGLNLSYSFKRWAVFADYSFYTKERYIEYEDLAGNTLQKPYTFQSDLVTFGLMFYPNVK